MTNDGASQDGNTRQAAYALGLAGLLPFIGLAALVLAGSGPVLGIAPRMALLTYGAVIASFLGGIRWGVALRGTDHAPRDLALSVVPSLLAWGCLALHAPIDLAALGFLVLAWGLVDQDMPRRSLAPSWFGRLRLLLSGVAGRSLLASAFA